MAIDQKYSFLLQILDSDEHDVRGKEGFLILNEARRIRNSFAHDNLEGIVLEKNEDYVYSDKEVSPNFKFIDLINVITYFLTRMETVLDDWLVLNKEEIKKPWVMNSPQ